MKRKRSDETEPAEKQSRSTPNKARQSDVQSQEQTPAKRRRGRPPGSKNKKKPQADDDGVATRSVPATPSAVRQKRNVYETPSKVVRFAESDSPSGPVRTADRSARRKSARNLIQRTISGNLSDEDGLGDDEDDLARDIWDVADSDGDANVDADGGSDQRADSVSRCSDREAETAPSPASTPSKRPRGRPPKTTARKRTPTPPRDLPAHERYFFDNRPGGNKTSNNTLSSLKLLSHEDYFGIIRDYIDHHERNRALLHGYHARAFRQWRFELSEGYSVCLYGFGSKRKLMMEFADWLCAIDEDDEDDEDDEREAADDAARVDGDGGGGGEAVSHPSRVIVVNGYVSNVSVKDIVHIVAQAAFGADHGHKLGGQPGQMLDVLLGQLSATATQPCRPLTLMVHSMDGPSLRSASAQALLSRLASHARVRLICSVDQPSFGLLWDSGVREAFNFAFHDCTTFDPYEAEIDVVDAVNDLLGRSGRRVAGKEGVAYVLKSLPENARNLYRVLVAEQLAALDDDYAVDGTNPDEDEGRDRGRDPTGATAGPAHARRAFSGDTSAGRIEYRVLYQKAVEEFICGSEIAFRTLLKEYVVDMFFLPIHLLSLSLCRFQTVALISYVCISLSTLLLLTFLSLRHTRQPTLSFFPYFYL